MFRQRVLFLKENYILRILKRFILAGLFAIALLLILVHKIDLGLISGVSKSVMFVTVPVINTLTMPARGLSYGYKQALSVINVYQENKRLIKENDELYLLKDRMKALKAENDLLKKLLHHYDTPEVQSRTARVVAETGGAFANALIIYLGDNSDEIKIGYPVVCSKGLIGRIDLISGKYARVTLLTDINSKIPVVSQKSRERGIISGVNAPEMKLLYTPLLAELQVGDILVTSGVGGGLPPDIPAARIKQIDMDSITVVPLFNPSETEIVKILLYDVAPTPETMKELQ
jgi:rod shape-determining protein MreC